MRSAALILLAGAVLTAASAAPDFSKQVQFFSGLYLLQEAPGLSQPEKSAKYRELESLTGIDSKTAQQLISRYRTDPAAWRKLSDSVAVLVSRCPAKPASPRPATTQKGQRR